MGGVDSNPELEISVQRGLLLDSSRPYRKSVGREAAADTRNDYFANCCAACKRNAPAPALRRPSPRSEAGPSAMCLAPRAPRRQASRAPRLLLAVAKLALLSLCAAYAARTGEFLVRPRASSRFFSSRITSRGLVPEPQIMSRAVAFPPSTFPRSRPNLPFGRCQIFLRPSRCARRPPCCP